MFNTENNLLITGSPEINEMIGTSGNRSKDDQIYFQLLC